VPELQFELCDLIYMSEVNIYTKHYINSNFNNSQSTLCESH